MINVFDKFNESHRANEAISKLVQLTIDNVYTSHAHYNLMFITYIIRIFVDFSCNCLIVSIACMYIICIISSHGCHYSYSPKKCSSNYLKATLTSKITFKIKFIMDQVRQARVNVTKVPI